MEDQEDSRGEAPYPCITQGTGEIIVHSKFVPNENLLQAAARHLIEKDELDEYNFDPNLPYTQISGTFSATEVWGRVQEIMEAAAECEGDLCSESAWNSEVHCRLLFVALRGWRSARHVSYMDV